MIDGLKISIPQRLILLRVVLIFSLFISIFLSFSLWAGYREFPYTPVIPVPQMFRQYDFIFISFAILFWLCSLFLKQQRLFIFLAFAVSVFMVLMDITRLQPWFYIYNSLLVVFLFYNGRVDDPNKFTSVFILLQLIFASVYFYIGLSQLNSGFVNTVFPELISPLKELMSERQFLFFKKMGSIVPFLMMFIGMGFIISPVRYLSIALAIMVHGLLFIFLFPSVANTNYTLWFSNLSFMAIAILLFSGKTKQRYFSPTFLFKMPLFYLVAAVFLVLPAFNQAGKWPDFLSFNFESGNNNSAVITVSPAAKEQLPPYLKHFCRERNGVNVMDYTAWCRHELGASCIPATPVFTGVQKHLQNLTGTGVKDIQLELVPKENLLIKP